MGDHGGDADPQHLSGVTDNGTIEGHLNNFVCYGRFIRLIKLVELETMVTITETITLETSTSFAMTGNQLTLAGRTFN